MLITRPQPGAEGTAARVAALGLTPVLAPVLTIVTRALPADSLVKQGQLQAVLITSGNAIPALPAALHATLLLAVGDATAARATAAGFTRVVSAGRDAEALVALAASRCSPHGGPLLLASGAGQGQELVEALRARGFRVQRRVAYEARPVEILPEPARAALQAGTLRAALFFSPESAQTFVTILLRDMPAAAVRNIDAFAISANTETVLAALPWRRVRVASHPSQDELLGLLTMTEPTPPTQDEPPALPDPQRPHPVTPPPSATAKPLPADPLATLKPPPAKAAEPAPAGARSVPPPPPRRIDTPTASDMARRPPEPPVPPSRDSALPVLTAGGLLLLLILIGWVWTGQRDLREQVAQLAAQPPPPPPPASVSPAQLAGLDGKLGELDKRLTAVQQRPPAPPPPDLAPLSARLAALEGRKPEVPPDTTAPLAQKLESVVAEASASKSADAALADRLGDLDTRVKQAEQHAADAVKNADDSIKTRLADLDTRLKLAEERQAALAARAAGAQRVEQALLALEAGEALGDLPGAAPALTRFATAKPPTEAALRLSYPAAAAAAAKSSDPGALAQSMGERMLLRASALVTVKQGDKVLVGQPSETVLADAHAQVEAGDLAGAVATLDKLDPAAARAMAGWRGQAQSLLEARAALAQMVRS